MVAVRCKFAEAAADTSERVAMATAMFEAASNEKKGDALSLINKVSVTVRVRIRVSIRVRVRG